MSALGLDGTTYAVFDVALDEETGATSLVYDGAPPYHDLGEADAEARRRSELGRTSCVCRITPVSYFAGRTPVKN